MNGVRVYTESTCHRCGKVDVREGEEAETPPVGWAHCRMARHEESEASHKSKVLANALLCPECTNAMVVCLENVHTGTVMDNKI